MLNAQLNDDRKEGQYCDGCGDFCPDDLTKVEKEQNFYYYCKGCSLNMHEDLTDEEREIDDQDKKGY